MEKHKGFVGRNRNGNKYKNKISIRLRYQAMAAVLLLLALSFVSYAPVNAQQEKNVVRVGYFAFDGYHNQDEDGNRSGYGYEYLQMMARYTGWSYEYVGYDKSWNEAQQMLEKGEIDILTSAQKTAEREKIFDFSEDPIGYSSTIFTIKAGNDKYTIDDFDSFEGVRVGMLEGNSRNRDFEQFANEKGFSYEPVMFEDMSELLASLHNETIDAVVTSSIRVTDGEWLVSQFGFSPYYVCVKKGNSELLAQVNEAIGRINQANPSLQNELEDKYYAVDSGEEVAYTAQERQYIEDYISSGDKLKVVINPDRRPLSFYEDGEFTGIYGDAAKEILERTGLPYEILEPANRSEYQSLREQHGIDLCMDMCSDFNEAEREHYRLTDSYDAANVSRITRSEYNGEMSDVATIRYSDIVELIEKQLPEDTTFTYYDTVSECVEAVRSGEQDAAYLYTYVAEEYVSQDIRHQLTATLMPDLSMEFCVGIADTQDTLLFSILNKSVESVDRGWIDEKTVTYTAQNDRTVSLLELVYNNPLSAIGVIAAILLCIGAVIIMLYRQQAAKRDAQNTREIQRLFSYVCRANESVLEVNLSLMQSKEYYLKDGVLCVEEKVCPVQEEYEQFVTKDGSGRISENLTMERMEEIIQNGEEYVFEALGRDKNGIHQWYIYTIHGMKPDEIHPNNFMLFKRNINDLKEREESNRKALMDALQVAKEASEAKGNFMSRMSHEIRTPLNAVIGYLTLSEDCLKEPEKIKDYIEKCQSAARHLLNIINDVLDISAIESGKIKIASDEFDLKELLQTISLMFYNQAKAKGIEFQVEVLDMTQEIVIGDQLRLNQILMNLLSNAMKFTPEGGSIRVSVRQLQQEEGQVRFRFAVSDSGIGMSKEYMSRIFRPFEQEKAETARKYGGSGLGLSITNNLITMMQGSIDVESEEGKGTTFTVHLVFGESQKVRGTKKNDFAKVRALIVDDEKRSCDYMKALLKRCKVKSDVVLSGEEAVRQVKRRKGTDYEYDLCLMDWNMPGIDGVETARRIHEECGSNIPIIIASAYDVNEIRDIARTAGVTKLIAKPLFQSTMFDLLVDTFGAYEPDMEAEFDKSKMDFTGIRVLLAEDNEMNREIAVTILKKSGLVVDTAVDGQQAYEKFVHSKKDTYQVILMDIQMPVMDGHEATRVIRSSKHEQAKDVPIIAMTANAFTEDVTAALACGMNDHIAKPIDYDKLYQLLVKYIKDKTKE